MSAKLGSLVVKFLWEVLAWMIAVVVINTAVALAKGAYKIVRKKISTFRKTELAPAK